MAVNIVTGMTGVEHITSHDDRARNASQFGRGKYVFDVGNKFSASIIDDNLVRIQDGMCINQGTQMGIEPNDYADVEIDNGLLGTNRHDIIVMRYEKNEETLLEKASLAVVKGVNSSKPVDPDITEGNILDGGDLVDDMPLYRVVIKGVNFVSIEPLFEVFDGDVGSILEELEDKVDKVTGKGLSTNDYTNEDKTKLDGIDTGAEVNVQSDWSQNDNTADDFIKHKPGIPSKTSDLQNDSNFVSDADYTHTDNNYTDADKEDVAKINTIEHSLSTTKTATGNPISISNSAHVNAEELTVELEPIQDLHGYDKPWVGGAGKNMIPMTMAGIKAANTTGTWNGNVYSIGTATIEILTDDGDNVRGIKVLGSVSENTPFFLYQGVISTFVDDSNYYIKDCVLSDNISVTYADQTFTAQSYWIGNSLNIMIVLVGSQSYNNTYYPQIEAGQSATTFEPYSNICPISGYDETSVVVKDTADNPTVTDTYTLQFGDTVYGAEVDFASGVATVDRAMLTLDGTEQGWSTDVTSGGKRRFTNAQLPSLGYNTSIVRISAVSNLFENTKSVDYDLMDNVFILRYINDSNRIDIMTEQFADVTEWTTFLGNNNMQVLYMLATPYTIQLTPQQIKMLKGNNVLVADGDMNLSYQVDSVVGDVKEWAEEHFIPYNSYNTPPVYGFHIDGNNSDPASRVTYIADNANYTPAYMDYTSDKFRYNSWRDIWFIKECKPCILNQDGTVKAYLNPNDQTKDIDGNTVVIDENLTGANVEIEFPKIWYKVVPDAENVAGASVYFSPVKVDEDYKDYAYIDKDGVHKEHFYMPAYNGSVLSGTTIMRSLSGQAVSKNLDASTEIAYAKANGDGWNTEDAGEIMLINLLLILLGKSTDTQTVFGRGIDSGGDTAFNNYVTGAGNLKGLFYGTNTGTGLVKVFGIENWWGLQWRRYAGDVLNNGVRKIKLCYGNEDGSTTFDFNIDGTGYVDVGVTPGGTNGGYIRTMKFAHDGMYSAISDGSSSTYFCDGQWFNNAHHTVYAFRGGGSAHGVRCGAFGVDLADAPEARNWDRGAAVSYK